MGILEESQVRIESLSLGLTGISPKDLDDLKVIVHLKELALQREIFIKPVGGQPLNISVGEQTGLELQYDCEVINNPELKPTLTASGLFQRNLEATVYVPLDVVNKVIESSISFEVYSMGGYSINLEPQELPEELRSLVYGYSSV